MVSAEKSLKEGWSKHGELISSLSNHPDFLGPVVIGGVGGSGTRVVTRILMKLGFYMGHGLNHAHDNVWFTLLIRRPEWLLKNLNNKAEIFQGLSLFEKAMAGHLRPRPEVVTYVIRALFQGMFHKNIFFGIYPLIWLIPPAITVLRPRKIDFSRYIGWGWKETNSHLVLEHLNEYFDNLRYIHIVRHGLDMAYGRSKGDFELFCEFFGVELPKSFKLRPKAKLNYWIRANERAISLGERLLGERFLFVNFDQLCYEPEPGVERIVNFLGVKTATLNLRELARGIKIPNTIGRYSKHDLSILSEEEINAVRKFGFEVGDKKW